MTHEAIKLALVLALADGLTLVVVVLALTERYFELCQAFFIDEKVERDNGFAGIFNRILELAKLATVEQELPVATDFVIHVRTELIGSDMHLLDPQFASLKDAVGIGKRGLAVANGLDFRAIEDNPGRETVENLVIERGALIADIYI